MVAGLMIRKMLLEWRLLLRMAARMYLCGRSIWTTNIDVLAQLYVNCLGAEAVGNQELFEIEY